MTLEVRVRPEAEQDLTEGAIWYEEQSPELGAQFLDEVLATCTTLRKCRSCMRWLIETRGAL